MSPSARPRGVRSAEIGREAETAVVTVLREHGFPAAERRRVRRQDALDIVAAPGVIVSVKGGQQARTASLGKTVEWRVEAERKRVEQGADVALLVVQRQGYGRDRADSWRCWILGLDRDGWETTLRHALAHLRAHDYGDPIEDDGS